MDLLGSGNVRHEKLMTVSLEVDGLVRRCSSRYRKRPVRIVRAPILLSCHISRPGAIGGKDIVQRRDKAATRRKSRSGPSTRTSPSCFVCLWYHAVGRLICRTSSITSIPVTQKLSTLATSDPAYPVVRTVRSKRWRTLGTESSRVIGNSPATGERYNI
jgi:hypothetical protein